MRFAASIPILSPILCIFGKLRAGAARLHPGGLLLAAILSVLGCTASNQENLLGGEVCTSLRACCNAATFPADRRSDCGFLAARSDAASCEAALRIYASAGLCGELLASDLGVRDGSSGSDIGFISDGGSSSDIGFISDGSISDGSAPGGPVRILELSATAAELTEGEAVTFVAIVTDSNGLDCLAGGLLTDATTSATYGAFGTGAKKGAYQLTLSWQSIHQTQSIDFTPTSSKRAFVATFYDNSGASTSRRIELNLVCRPDARSRLRGACAASCVDFASNSSCGSCGKACLTPTGCSPDGTCTSGTISACSVIGTFKTCSEYCVSKGKKCSASCPGYMGRGRRAGTTYDESGYRCTTADSPGAELTSCEEPFHSSQVKVVCCCA